MEISHDIEIIELDSFDTAFVVAPGEELQAQQRFMTLFAPADSPDRRGGSGRVRKVRNAMGEVFALKTLRADKSEAPVQARPLQAEPKVLRSLGDSPGLKPFTPDYVTTGYMNAFFEEYRMHFAVSGLRGFPALYGFGMIGQTPAILMEWVNGVTLRDAMASGQLAAGKLPLKLVAHLGIAVLEQLEHARHLSSEFVHRDISPRNVMLRCDHSTLDQQIESSAFDVCLIDFGSAALDAGEPSFTMEAGVWRKGTPAYAPPEMLTSDVELPDGTRQSETIDTYALCSVLYELYGGRRPFEMSPHIRQSPYRAKTESLPDPLNIREPDGGFLADTLLAGLAQEQHDRLNTAQLKDALGEWLTAPSQHWESAWTAASVAADAKQSATSHRQMTRRAFVASGIVAAGAVISGAIVGNKLLGRNDGIDQQRYETVSTVYSGEPLYKVLDSAASGWAFATRTGKIALAAASSREPGRLSEGLIGLFDDISERYGFIAPTNTRTGYAWKILPKFACVGDFSEGLAAVQDRETRLWGFVDASGAWAIRPAFSAASAFSNGAAAVRANDAAGLWGAIDTGGAWVIKPAFYALGQRASNGVASAQDNVGDWRMVDADGNTTHAGAFQQLRRYEQHCAPAIDDASGLWGFIDVDGTWMIDPQFSDARPFCSGVAAVQERETLLWHFIDAATREYHPKQPRFWKLGDVVDGLAPAQASEQDSTIVFDESDPDARAENAGGHYGYVDSKGAWQMRHLTTLVDTAIGAPGI